MNWITRFLPEADDDLNYLDGSVVKEVRKAIKKVGVNPLPVYEGGYGKPLGNKHGNDLTGLLKVKLAKVGIRIVYKLIRTETEMLIIVIGARADDEVYRTAKSRMKKYGL